MKRSRMKFVLASVCVVLAIGVFAGMGSRSAGQEESLKTVAVQEIGDDSGGSSVILSGNITPKETVKLSFKVPGLVAQIPVSEGDMVQEGQVVATLDQNDYSLQQKAALAQWQSAKMQIDSEIPTLVNKAQAQLELTEASYNRVKELYDAGAASQSQLDEIEAKLTVDQNSYRQASEAKGIAMTELEMAEAAYELAASQMGDTVIRSTIEGVVLSKVAEAGEVTAAGYPVVAVGKIDQVYAEIGVPDDVIPQLAEGQSAQVYVYGLERWVSGTVEEIGFLADSYTRMFPVKILLDNPEMAMRPGMTARVELLREDSPSIYVPFSSVIQLADSTVVFLYDQDTSTVKKTEVETGELYGDTIEILSGLSRGDKIVTEGQFRLKDQEEVTLKEGAL